MPVVTSLPFDGVINVKWAGGSIYAGGQLIAGTESTGRRYDSVGSALSSYPVTAYQTLVGPPGSREALPVPKPFVLQSIAGLSGGGAVAGYFWFADEDIVPGDGINVDAPMLVAYNDIGEPLWGDVEWSTLGTGGGGVRVASDSDGFVYAIIDGPDLKALRKYDQSGGLLWSVPSITGIICASASDGGTVVVLKPDATLAGYSKESGALVWSRSPSPSEEFGLAMSRRSADVMAISTGWQYVEYFDALTGALLWQAQTDPAAFVAGLDVSEDGDLFVSADVFATDVKTSVYRYSGEGDLVGTFANLATDPEGISGSFLGNDLNGGLIATDGLFLIGHAAAEEKSGGVILHEWLEYTFTLKAFQQDSGAPAWTVNWGLWTEGAAEGEMTGPGAIIIRAPQYELIRALGT